MDKTFKFNDITGFYTDEGNGKTIVIIHGFAEDGSTWADFGKQLSSDYRVIIPDLPGYRQSELPKQTLTVEWMADFVHAILEKEKVTDPIIIGHSMGGYITLALAEKYPALPGKIGLFHSHAYADDEEKKKGRQKSIDFVNKNGTADFINELYNNLFGEKFRTENKATVDSLKAYAQKYAPATMTAGLSAMMQRPDRTHVLKQFKKPVLFILGKEDKAIPYDKSVEQCKFPAVSEVHIMEGVGHMGMIESPEKTLLFVRDFVNL